MRMKNPQPTAPQNGHFHYQVKRSCLRMQPKERTWAFGEGEKASEEISHLTIFHLAQRAPSVCCCCLTRRKLRPRKVLWSCPKSSWTWSSGSKNSFKKFIFEIKSLTQFSSHNRTSTLQLEGLPQVAQWLRLCAPNARGWVQCLVRELDPTRCNQEYACCN